MKEKLRDKTRDDLNLALRSLGVDAEMAERGRPEEKVGKSLLRRSLGLLDIRDGPISAINVIKQDRSQHSPPFWWAVLLIPSQLPGAVDHPVEVSTRRLKSFPLLGKITGIEWRGEDFGAGLLDALNQDRKLVELVKRVGDFEIRSHANEFNGWTIQIRARLSPEKGNARRLPSWLGGSTTSAIDPIAHNLALRRQKSTPLIIAPIARVFISASTTKFRNPL